ncbi:hypothetical protein [Bacillus halotolerans]|uniref:hypothetical protein n=1 Tax=Bacillus halotolerans TaxID=260554 RepID=UPI001ED8EE7E|nr:hypothetical protein [Bacillus halotolerans]
MEDSLKIDTFLLSCGALGKGIEHKVLSGPASYAREKLLATLSLEFKDSGRNRAFSEFLAAHRFEEEVNRVYHIFVRCRGSKREYRMGIFSAACAGCNGKNGCK